MSPEYDRKNQIESTVQKLLKLYLAINPKFSIDQLVNGGFGFRLNEGKTEVLWVKTWEQLDEKDHALAKPKKSTYFTVKLLANSSKHDPKNVNHGRLEQFRSSRSSR